MEHNHLENCLRGWVLLVEGLALVGLANVVFLGLLGGAGRLLARRLEPRVIGARVARGASRPVVSVDPVTLAVQPALCSVGGRTSWPRTRRRVARGARSLPWRVAACSTTRPLGWRAGAGL